jgi:hypothetical protein
LFFGKGWLETIDKIAFFTKNFNCYAVENITTVKSSEALEKY